MDMKANFSYNNHINPNFKSLVSKTKTLKDVFYKNQFAQMQKKSINQIVDITPIQFAGTSCKGSIPLQNFWHFFKLKNPKLKSNYFGLSTNKDGYADSFLKEKSNVPLSTSFVHNCSAMYLYNDKTKTHALYHAAPDCSAEHLNSMIQRLMPEGISKAAIIPGDFFFYNEHSHNMNNMLKLIKQNSPNAKVNVYHDSTRFPEVVGYRGDVYEIPNKIVMKEMKINPLSAHDEGQASFKILDLQGANTLNEIYSKAISEDNINALKKEFKQKKYPALLSEIFINEINEVEKILKYINKIDSLEDLEFYQANYPQKTFKQVFRKRKEELLLKELEKVDSLEGLQYFYKKARLEFVRMRNLFAQFSQKKKEFYNK